MNESRKRRVMARMAQMNLLCVIISDPESVYYLTGRVIQPGERMLALVLKGDGDIRLFVNRLFAQSPEAGLPVTEFDDTQDCVALLAAHLPAGRVGVDKKWPSLFTIRLMEARPDISLALGSQPVDESRMFKDEEEIARMRASSHMNDRALERLIRTLRPGDTEAAVGRRYVEIGREMGASGPSFEPLVCFGKNGAEPHHESDDTPLREGDMVILDLGLAVHHAMSDMTRTVALGRATDKQREIYELVRAANEAGRGAVAPGVPLREIDRAARSVIEKAGYGEYFIHRTGHGIGLEVHEPPDVSSSSEYTAQPGMIFSVEPGVYLPGEFGVRIEDLVLVTEDGHETLNQLPRELIEL